jgi:hypothetical protein
VHDADFVSYVADQLAGLPGVTAVSLGGSRAWGTHRPDSDWDFAIYYRGRFEPQALRGLGWVGEVFEIGDWGGGVFNGGAWLRVDGRRTDVHYRDLDSIDHEIGEAQAGRFLIEPLMFHLAGIPTYLVLAEIAGSRVLRGELPRAGYPPALAERAPRVWWDRADRVFGYARDYHAPAGRLTLCAGLIAQATAQAAHAVLAGQAEWVTNEKTLLARAGLQQVDHLLDGVAARPDPLAGAVGESWALCRQAVLTATSGRVGG